MKQSVRLARRYAQALGELAVEKGLLDKVEAEFSLLIRLIDENAQWRRLMYRPHVSPEAKLAVLREVLDGQLSPLMTNFLRLVIRKRREAYLPAMYAAFKEFADEARGIVRVKVRSAAPLESAVAERLRQRLGQWTGKRVEMELEVDPSLMGGVVVRMGDIVMDGSVAGRLERLRGHLRAADIRVG